MKPKKSLGQCFLIAEIERLDVRPHHPKVADHTDPLHEMRAKEVTSLWRLEAR